MDIWGNHGGMEELGRTVQRNNGGREGIGGTIQRNNGGREGLQGEFRRRIGGTEGFGREEYGMDGQHIDIQGNTGGLAVVGRGISEDSGGMEEGMSTHYIMSQDFGGGLATHV